MRADVQRTERSKEIKDTAGRLLRVSQHQKKFFFLKKVVLERLNYSVLGMSSDSLNY
jgi:hypothetical protein